MSYSIVETPAASPDIKGTATAIVLESRNKSKDKDGLPVTIDVYSGAATPIFEMYDDYRVKPLVKNIVTGNGMAGKKTLTITWQGSGSSGGEDETDAPPEWTIDPIEAVRALAAHPYFQTAYAPGSGEIVHDRLAEADYAISRGKPYVATGTYKTRIARYYGLRMAGVDGFPVYGISITKSFKTNSKGNIQDAFENAGISVNINDINPPEHIQDGLEALQRIASYGSDDPGSFVMAANNWEFVQRPPRVNGPEDGPWSVSIEWIGLDQYSAVIYPRGSWDPIGAEG